MKSRGLTVMFVLALTVSLGVCEAQQATDPFLKKEIFLQGGGSFFTGNEGEGQSSFLLGPNGQILQAIPSTERSIFSRTGRFFGGLRYWFHENHAVEGSFSYAPNQIRVLLSSPTVEGESVAVNLRAGMFALNYVFRSSTPCRLQPFLTTGIGFGVYDGIQRREARFNVNFGAGTDFLLSDRIGFRLEVRDFFGSQPKGGLTAPGGGTHNIAPTAGIFFRF